MAAIKLLQFFIILSILFLQTGISYWISTQVFAFIIFTYVIYLNKPKLILNLKIIIPIFLFILFIIDLYFYRAFLINWGQVSNLFLSTIRLIFFSSTIYFLFFLQFENNNFIKFTTKIYKYLLIIFPSLLLISESNLIPFLSKESLFAQNASLVFNLQNIDNINLHIAALNVIRPDLFYGEPSYLALIIFCIFSGYIFSNFVKSYNSNSQKPELFLYKRGSLVFASSTILSLFLTRSLSGILYIFLIIFLFLSVRFIYQRVLSVRIILFGGIIIIFITSLFLNSYLLSRLDFTNFDQLSLFERILFFLKWTLRDYIFGIQSIDKISSDFGFVNGFFFGIAVGGIGFLLYFFSLITRIRSLVKSLPFNIYSSFLLLAIFMQNGSIFAPDKAFMIFLTFSPLLSKKTIKLK